MASEFALVITGCFTTYRIIGSWSASLRLVIVAVSVANQGNHEKNRIDGGPNNPLPPPSHTGFLGGSPVGTKRFWPELGRNQRSAGAEWTEDVAACTKSSALQIGTQWHEIEEISASDFQRS